jgi:hypothetical protein
VSFLHHSLYVFKPFQGSVTRSQAWNCLQDTGRVFQNTILIQGQKHSRRNILMSKLSALREENWTKEFDMYPDLIGAIRDGLYKETNDLLVVDSHQHKDFYADISVATYDDARLPYSVRYFLELKFTNLNHERRSLADRCWIISILYVRSNHIGHAL